MKPMRFLLAVVASVLFILFCLYTCPITKPAWGQGPAQARVVAETDRANVWQFTDVVEGNKIVCYFLQNKDLVSGKLHSGLTCMIIKQKECPTCPTPCPDPNVHEIRDGSLF